jgi:hypothetical protein
MHVGKLRDRSAGRDKPAMKPRKPSIQPPAAKRKTRQKLPKKANWVAWRAIHMMPLRDAVALSLDFEPSTVTVEHGEFADRLKIAVAQFRSQRILKLNIQSRSLSTPPALSPVWLPHFAAWAKVRPRWKLPAPLAGMAQAKLSAAAKSASPAQRHAAQVKSWQHAVRALADDICLKDQRAGIDSTIKDIARRVAVAAAKQSIRGPRGELTPENIQRAALQGGKWKRPALKKKT